MRHVLAYLVLLLSTQTATAQVAQWNHVVQDPELQFAFSRALREVSNAYIDRSEAQGTPAAITFVDTQFDYPLQLTTANARHVVLNANVGKINYLILYQAETSNGVTVPILRGLRGFYDGTDGGHDESGALVPGDGGVMICLENRSGLEIMMGALAISSLAPNGQFRSDQDGSDIEALHERLVSLTYECYGQPTGG